MVTLLSKIFIKNRKDFSNGAVRLAYGTLCGFLGIFLNVLLFAAKLFAGAVTGAISVTADAFNNLSDAGSSLISLIGFKLSGQRADKEHPFGHGRLEYVAGLAVSMAVILMGFELGKESFMKILHPQPIAFSAVAVWILIASVIVKFYMYFYNRAVSEKIDSPSMRATAVDSLSDCLSTAVVLVSMLVFRFADLNVDAYCGLLVSLVILYAGVKSAKATISPLLGTPPTKELTDGIEATVTACPDILGMHDLVVHDYGPGRFIVSLHAEVCADSNLVAIHNTIDGIERELYAKFGCDATIHIDPVENGSEKLRANALAAVKSIDKRLSIHDFRTVADGKRVNVVFDVLAPFEIEKSDDELASAIKEIIESQENGGCFATIKIDRAYM